MAEKVELNLRDIKLLSYDNVANGRTEFDNEDLQFFEKETWKLFVYQIGQKLVEKYKNKIEGKECLINFHHTSKEDLEKASKKTFMGKNLVSPLFYIKFDNNSHIEFCDRSGEKIPKIVFFMILCR